MPQGHVNDVPRSGAGLQSVNTISTGDHGMHNPVPPAEGWTVRNAYTLAMLTLIYALNTVDRNMFGLMAPLIKADLHFTDTQIGLLSGFAFAAFYAVMAVPIASLADRWNRRNIIAIGLTFWSLMTFCHGLVRTGWELALTRFLLGAGEASSVPPSNSIIADLFGPAKRPFALGFLAASTSIGVLLLFPALGWISEAHGWRVAFMAAGLPGLALALLFWLTIKEPSRATGSSQTSDPVPLPAALHRLATTPAFVLAVASGIFISFDLAVSLTWAPTFLSRVHGLSQGEIGQLVGLLRGVGGIIGGVGGGLVATMLGHRDPRWRYRVPAAAMILVAPAELLFIFGGDGLWQFGLGLDTLLVIAQIGPLFAILLAAADTRTRAVGIAVFLLITNLVGQSAGPLVSGFLSDRLAPSLGDMAIGYAMLTGSAAAIVAGLLCLAAGRRTEEKLIAQSASH
jgi:MFS family permease